MPDSHPAPTSVSPQQRSKPTLSDLAPNYPEPKRLQEMLPYEAYIIEGFLGQGGMGAVYQGIQISLNRPVAIKVMRLGVGESFDHADRFRREAQAMAALNHPGIVAVHDFGMAGEFLYIVMEYVDGSDLQRVVQSGQMTPQIAFYLVPQICEALGYAHERGIIHRDIKPANILLTKDWRVKVADFGLAKRFDADNSLMTRSNVSLGTPDYAAPEQFKDPASVDHRADIYSIGVTFYQMLTGELPRGAWQAPSAMVNTDPRLDPILIKALMPRREDRYQSVRELQQSLASINQVLESEAQERVQAESAANQAATLLGLKPARAKSKAPLHIGLGAAAAIGIGALVLLSGGEKMGQASSSTESPSATGPVGVLPSVSMPATTNPAHPATAGPGTLPADLHARLDAVPWKKVDLSGGFRNLFGKGVIEYREGRLHLKDEVYAALLEDARDVALRVRFAQGSRGSNSVQLRHHSSFAKGKKLIAGRSPSGGGVFSLNDQNGNTPLTVSLPLPAEGSAFTLETFAIGSSCGVNVDGHWVACKQAEGLAPSGQVVLCGEGAVIESIEYKILDGVAAPTAAAGGKASVPPSTAPLEWQKLDFSKPFRRAYKEPKGSCENRKGMLELRGQFFLLIADNCRDVAVRVRFAANPLEADNKVGLRALYGASRVHAGRQTVSSLGKIVILDGRNVVNSNSAPMFALPATGEAWTLEMFALGDCAGVFVNEKLAASIQIHQVAHAGNVQISAGHALIESIEYLVLDDVPRELWPAHLIQALEVGAEMNRP